MSADTRQEEKSGKMSARMQRALSVTALACAAFVLSYLFVTEGGAAGVKNWIFPTGVVAILLFALALRYVFKTFFTRS